MYEMHLRIFGIPTEGKEWSRMTQMAGQWIFCHWEELYYVEVERQPGLVKEGVLFIPPPVNDVTFRDGLWDEMNRKFGTLCDQYEEEIIDSKTLQEMASMILDFVRCHYEQSGHVEAIQIEVGDLTRWLRELSDFFADAASRNKNVVIEL